MPTMPLNKLAFLSEWLAPRMGKRNGPVAIFVQKAASPFRPGIRPEAEFSDKENSISRRRLTGALLYCRLSPAATASCSADFSGNHSPGGPEIMEKRGCCATPSSFVLQL